MLLDSRQCLIFIQVTKSNALIIGSRPAAQPQLQQQLNRAVSLLGAMFDVHIPNEHSFVFCHCYFQSFSRLFNAQNHSLVTEITKKKKTVCMHLTHSYPIHQPQSHRVEKKPRRT